MQEEERESKRQLVQSKPRAGRGIQARVKFIHVEKARLGVWIEQVRGCFTAAHCARGTAHAKGASLRCMARGKHIIENWKQNEAILSVCNVLRLAPLPGVEFIQRKEVGATKGTSVIMGVH